MDRRGFITGLISFAAASPAIVRASSLMPVRSIPLSITLEEFGRALKIGYEIVYEDLANNPNCVLVNYTPIKHAIIRVETIDYPDLRGRITKAFPKTIASLIDNPPQGN